ncbi:serine carboxypeptidase-like 42 [Cryptomeria japonica]|uniref:serine carboxypeptidase-like 42 n=1 Tax=Cryptomeria japonica TaxID=3369 RepID=UPI0025AD80B7|nr:serine carboxypeptidase-like 42 [Cryptomeria japonica]
MRLWLCFLLHILLFTAAKIKAGPAEDLIDRLPGQPEVNFKQYGGYVTVDKKAGRALYYYFVEAENDTQSTPLTLWLNGGPGCSSLGGGAFTELGPFYPLGDGRGLRRNSQSWNKVSNLLFVESPVGVGWSYSNTTSDYNRGDESTAMDMLTFLSNWIQRFPEYAFRDLFLAGESYAGHYIPQLAAKVIKYNEGNTSYKFNLKGVLIGNPLLVLNVDSIATFDYYWSHGLTSDESYISFKKKCVDITNSNKECDDIIDEIENEVGNYVDPYDVIVDICPTELIEQELRLQKKVTHMSLGTDVCVDYERSFYFNLPDVQKSLHANTTNLPYGWSMCSGIQFHKVL